MLLKEISPTDAPLDLLLLADPSENKVKDYLSTSRCFAAYSNGIVAGVGVVKQIAGGTYELINIAVAPSRQKSGIGTRLLKYVITEMERAGAHRLEVGTGTFGYQLAFYQRQGFRVAGIDRDFFLRNYPDPLFEDGIQHRDMLRLSIDYPIPSPATTNSHNR